MDTKNFTGYLYLNWKDDDMKLRKSSPSSYDVKPYEKAVKVDIDVEVPEQNVPEISKTLEVPEVEVREAVVDALDFEHYDEEGLPEPQEVLLHDEEFLVENFEEIEPEEYELSKENLDWLRNVLAYEYQNSNREAVVKFLESKLTEWKEKAPSKAR